MVRRPAVFLDRDGTLVELVPDPETGAPVGPLHPEQLVLRRHAARFVRGLNELGYLCLVVTNQPGLAKGTLTLERLARVHERLYADLRAGGAYLDGIEFCPHHPSPGARGRRQWAGPCGCRKPEPGLVLAAAATHGVELRRSYLVGDQPTDVRSLPKK